MNGEVRVLIAEDDLIAQAMLVSALESWGYRPILATDGREALDIMSQPDPPQMAILDWTMPSMSGIEVCRHIRQHNPIPYTFIVLLTHRDEQTDRLTGLESGADDFVTKPFDPRELRLRLRTGLRILQLQQQLEDARDASRLEANSDQLTGLWNRRSLHPRLEREIARCRESRRSLSVIMLDIDHFKSINDGAGHAYGDSALKLVAQTIKQGARADDFVGRFGGDEFIVVLPGADEDVAKRAAERIRLDISSSQLLSVENPFSITVSIGVAEVTGIAVLTPEIALSMADRALYAAKRAGRNRVVCFDDSMEPGESSLQQESHVERR
ncbi:MAG: diguanylate cyclase [Fuerstiella sp.]